MRRPTLGFLHETCGETSWVAPKRSFWEILDHSEEIPDEPGVYVLFSDQSFPYPIGRSPVFYIGQSDDLRFRLLTHVKLALEARDDRKLTLYYPRYEYAARYGRWYAWARTWQGLSPEVMEARAMARFAARYRSFPITNAAGAWSQVDFPGYVV
jgi:hypothetical protein